MSEYTPDNWVLLKINNPKDSHYRVFGGWFGGYLGSDSWRLNSGIVRHEFDGEYWKFYGSSGSCYKCYLDSYRMSGLQASVFTKLQEKHGENFVQLVEDQAWTAEDWTWILPTPTQK